MPGIDPANVKLPRFSIKEKVTMTLSVSQPDGRRVRAGLVHKINDQDAQNHKIIKFLSNVSDGGAEQIMIHQEAS